MTPKEQGFTTRKHASSFTDVIGAPLPSSRLCMTFSFELKSVVTEPKSSEAHDAAVKQAAAFLARTADVKRRSKSNVDSWAPFQGRATKAIYLTLSKVHNAPFDPCFHLANGGPAVRYEFWYDQASPRMYLRVVTSFGEESQTIDGVMSVRIGLHAMEVLEGNEMKQTIFPRYPPFRYGRRHQLNFLHVLLGTLFRMLMAISCYVGLELIKLMGWNKELESSNSLPKVNSLLSAIKYFRRRGGEPAIVQLYSVDSQVTPPQQAFKNFIRAAEDWHRRLGLRGYLYLVNFSPLVVAATTQNIQDICSVEKRYEGALTRPVPPPNPPTWNLLNSAYTTKLFVNNYGRHDHHFQAKPAEFMWDWLHLSCTIRGCGCITINGVFMSWFRGLKGDFIGENAPFLSWGGISKQRPERPIAVMEQNMSWFSTMGPWKAIPE